jgi:hypothetical protein
MNPLNIFRIYDLAVKIYEKMESIRCEFERLYQTVRDMNDYLHKKSTTRILFMETKIETDGGKMQIISEETFRFPPGEIYRSIQIPRDLIPDMKSAWAPRLGIRITTREEKD